MTIPADFNQEGSDGCACKSTPESMVSCSSVSGWMGLFALALVLCGTKTASTAPNFAFVSLPDMG